MKEFTSVTELERYFYNIKNTNELISQFKLISSEFGELTFEKLGMFTLDIETNLYDQKYLANEDSFGLGVKFEKNDEYITVKKVNFRIPGTFHPEANS